MTAAKFKHLIFLETNALAVATGIFISCIIETKFAKKLTHIQGVSKRAL
jgi:hypothetical protein